MPVPIFVFMVSELETMTMMHFIEQKCKQPARKKEINREKTKQDKRSFDRGALKPEQTYLAQSICVFRRCTKRYATVTNIFYWEKNELTVQIDRNPST